MKKLNREQIQDYTFNILVFLDEICREHDIKYMLSSGTCLGAVRHKDFIPWDDDADVYMDRENYNKLFEVLQKQNFRYKLMDYKTNNTYYYPFPKLVDTLTKVHENYRKDIDGLGIYVDIFFIDGLPDDPKKMEQFINKINFKTTLLMAGFSSSKNIVKRTIKILLKPFINRVKLNNKLEKMCLQYQPKDCAKSMNVLWKGTPCETEVYYDLIEVPFRDHKFFIPRDYDKYLTLNYGDYMTPPPAEKQVTHDMDAYSLDL